MRRWSQFIILSLAVVAASVELDIMIPSLPYIRHSLGISVDQAQWIITLNFVGFSASALAYGPLSDRFGRRPVILVGLFVFAVGSVVCLLAGDIRALLLGRLLQGLGCSAPVTIGFSMAADIRDEREATKVISLLNSLLTGAMVVAPVVGGAVNAHFGWRSNFVLITVLSLVALVSAMFFLTETLAPEARSGSGPWQVAASYWTCCKTGQFWRFSLIAVLTYAGLLGYMTGASIVFTDRLRVSAGALGYYQAVVMLAFVVVSAATGKMIGKFGTETTSILGIVTVGLGSGALLATSIGSWASAIAATACMVVFAAGAALVIAIYVARALQLFPDFRGTSSSLLGVVRLLTTGLVIVLSGLFFDNTMLPIAVLVVLCAGGCIGLSLVRVPAPLVNSAS